eukprot:scaffold161364_cov40-Cyclotella_meneghiniana.AAC.1
MSPQEISQRINQLDREKSELMKCAESKCKRKCAGKLPNSPKVSYWCKRLRLFDRIRKHKITPLKDPRNLHRSCKVLAKDCSDMEILQPNDYTLEEVEARIIAIKDQLEAICLLEADFNWLNKLIFAHRLETHCRLHGLTPPEQFAKSKSCCEEASLIKNLTTDGGRILHNSSAITSNDFDQCYDRGCAPISGLAARAHGVSRQSTQLMLQTMQSMDYFIKTGFGISEEPVFGGSSQLGSKLMGFGQGSGAAPGGMQNIVTLVDNAYKRLGHGMAATSSISGRIFLLAAIIY